MCNYYVSCSFQQIMSCLLCEIKKSNEHIIRKNKLFLTTSCHLGKSSSLSQEGYGVKLMRLKIDSTLLMVNVLRSNKKIYFLKIVLSLDQLSISNYINILTFYFERRHFLCYYLKLMA